MLESFLNSIESVTLILLLTATGYFCAKKGWLGDEAKHFLSKFIMMIAVPFMCIYSLRYRLTKDMLLNAGVSLLVPFISISLLFVLSYIVGHLLKLPRKSLGVFIMMCSLSNTLFIGYPMCTILFGSDCEAYVIMFYLCSTCFTQCLGVTLIRLTGEESKKISPLEVFKKVITMPPIIGIIIGLSVVILDIQLPDIVMTYSKYMNQVVSPLALLVTGKVIFDIGLKNMTIDLKMTVVLIFRFLVGPALCFFFCHLFGITGLMRNVFLVQAAMPIVTQTVVAASEYKADEQFAAEGAAITTIASFIVIPVLMLILEVV